MSSDNDGDFDTYSAIVQDAEEGGFWAEVTELPGCLSQGESLVELSHNLMDAIKTFTESDKTFFLALDYKEAADA